MTDTTQGLSMLEMFKTFDLDVNGITLHGRAGGEGPPLLLLHGHPQTHVIWHRVAPALKDHFHVVMVDLRGYGHSSKPPGDAEHVAYSKRVMAEDMVALMRSLGFERFAVLAHDRGARVAHRLCLDHPERVERAMFLDIAPTLDMYERTDRAFASAYFHWFMLIQPAPLPERLIENNPRAWIDGVMGNRHAGLAPFAAEALAAYREAMMLPGTAHGMCEDYRASSTIDLEHDRLDRDAGRRIHCPLRVLWGQHGVIEKLFDPMALWQACASDVSGRALPCGHYLPEECPDEIIDETLTFFNAPAGAA
ncbi:alpha/beta fold hydrolase [Kushneria indalinina]|uniref:Haloacetate dehalogenase n=1 Tax=Kushneria indalinina DSM 14324 TaxID=1122140 RepID=A0A3D9DXC3_9GAMM|nr:alpha/beta hydrolase [Kushneria indalinina]REC95416.1 haloacetate dehalogenase [Kushneria indalinina DSM 14324]